MCDPVPQVLEVARYSDHPLAGARVLLLDAPGNIHSIYFRYKVFHPHLGTPQPRGCCGMWGP